MKLTYSKRADLDGKHHVKADGVVIGHIKREQYADKQTKWVWRTLAIAVHQNRSGACDTIEEAAEAIKASNPELIARKGHL